MAVTNGIITHIDAAGRFAYLTELNGDSVRIHGTLKDFDQLEKGSDVVLQYENEFIRGEYKKGAKALLEIYEPFEPCTVLGTVIRVSDKGFAFARCDGFEEDVHIGVDVFRKADIKPGRDLPILATVGKNARGFAATELRWKPEELAAWRAENLPVQEGVLKHFDPAKKFGHLRLDDGSQIFFHLNMVAEELHAGLFTRGYRRARFAFVVTEYKGKQVAMVTKLVSLAPEPAAEVVVLEDDVAVEDLMAEHAAETQAAIGQTPAESEAKPVKAPRKKAAAKPKGKVTGKSGGIPSAKDYGIHPDDQPADIASMAKSACSNGGGNAIAYALAAAAPAGNA